MKRPSLVELERRCQKPDYRRVGNWMARRFARPLALRVTWVILPSGISAHAMTLVAAATGVLAACTLGWGDTQTWIAGAALLQLWYLLDHVDGQLARWHGTASLDGVQLDYLMHHLIALVVPLGAGDGVAGLTDEPAYRHVGMVWGVAGLLVGLHNDTRYKAFVQRLKRVSGRLEVVGGGGARPQPAPQPRISLRGLTGWLMRKACEIHVTINMLSLLAVAMLFSARLAVAAAAVFLLAMAAIAVTVLTAVVLRSLRQHSAEQEFAAWYRPADGHELIYEDGRWLMQPARRQCDDSDAGTSLPATRSS